MYSLYSKNNQIIVEENGLTVYLVNNIAAKIQIDTNIVYLYDLFNKPNTFGHTFLNMGPLSNIIRGGDSSTGFASNEELYDYFVTICGTHQVDFGGNPTGKPELIDITLDTLIYEGYYVGNSIYRICKVTIESTLISRQWASGEWTNRTNLTYL